MSKFRRIYLNIFIFGTGMVVLVVELTGSRLLAPYFGNGIFVWSNIITVILLALAVGYWVGGWMADREPEYGRLMWLAVIAGILVSGSPVILRAVLVPAVNGFTSYNNSMVILSLFAAFTLFFVPTCLLGMIAPFANRLACHDANTIGRATGRLYALSTMGSIVGSLATTFLAVPYLGTRETIMIGSVILVILGLIGLGKWRYLPIIIIPVVLYLGARTANIQNGRFNIRPRVGLVYEKESPYQFIQIVNDKAGLSLITNEGLSRHSMITRGSIWVNNIYDTFSTLPAMMKPPGEKVSVLFLGLAGGTSSRQMNQLYGSKYRLTMTGVDIDSAMVEAGIKYLDMPIDKVDVRYMDARQYLCGTDQKYDLIILDAFAQQYDVPFHLLTQEFFRSVNDHLEPDGVFSMNVISVERHSQMNDSVTQTLGSVFSDVRIAAIPKSRNYLIVAGHDTMSLHSEWVANGPYPPITLAAVSQLETATPTNAKIFTDNWAPVEYLTEHAYLEANL